MAYAAKTEVSVDRSISEIVTMLRKAGADQVGQLTSDAMFSIQFTLANRMIRFRVRLPTIDEMPIRDGRGSGLTMPQRRAKADQAARQRARALMLVVKAKLESVESEVETFEQAFLANVVMSDGQTLYERISEPLALEYSTGAAQTMILQIEGPRS